MTLTPEQLDELETNARAELAAYISLKVPVAAVNLVHLVSVYRAALAWRKAKEARQATEVRAGTAETSDEHHAAMRELPAAKEADVLATMALLNALGGT